MIFVSLKIIFYRFIFEINTDEGEETDYYLYVNFDPFFWTVELMDEILEKLRAMQKENDDV